MFRNIFYLICFLTLNCISEKGGQEKDCISCRENVNKVFIVYKNEYEISILDFNKHICPKMSDLKDCVNKTTEWWPFLSQIIYSDNAPKYICKVLDPNCTVK